MEPDETLEGAARALAALAPEPARSHNVLTGTAGWTDPTLIKQSSFYPRGVRTAQARLEHYASQFGFVEVDATYYTLISEETTRRWVESTPSAFQFHIKAHPIVTGHPIDVVRLPGDLRQVLQAAGFEQRVYPDNLPAELRRELELRFEAPLAPLREAGKLTGVLAQFPPWFSATRGNARVIEELKTRFPELPFTVEFRHKSWLEQERRARVFDLLRALGYAYVVVDEPEGSTFGVPAVPVVTNPELSVVRFHGRNVSGWSKKGASVQQRFNYLYAPAELSEWKERMVQLSGGARQVHAVFNNCVRDYAVIGAKGLIAVLEGAKPTAPVRT